MAIPSPPIHDTDVCTFLDRAATPHAAVYDYGSAMFDRIVLGLAVDKNLSPDAVHLWVTAFLAALGIPSSLHGLARAAPILQYFVPHLLNERPSLPHHPAVDILQALCVMLRASQRKITPIVLPAGRVKQEESQLFTYHLQSFAPTGMTGPCPLYRLWGHRLHLGLRQILSDSEKAQTWKWYATSARAFFKEFPHGTLPAQLPHLATDAQPTDLFEEHVQRFKNACSHKLRDLDWSPGTLDKHCQRLIWLFQIRSIQPHTHHRSQEPGFVVSEPLVCAGSSRTKKNRRRSRKTDPLDAATIIDAGEGDEIHEKDPDPTILELNWSGPLKKRVLSHRPSLPYRVVNRYILHQFPFWWDTRSLTRPQLHGVYRAIDRCLTTQAGSYEGLALFLGLLLYTGRTPGSLLGAKLARFPHGSGDMPELDGQGVVSLDLQREVLFFKQRRLRSSFQPQHKDDWLPSSAWIVVPVPPPLLGILRRYTTWLKTLGVRQHGTPAFYVKLPTDRLVVLDKDHLQTLWKVMIQKDPCAPSPAQLASAFVPLMNHGMGLDEVASRLISGSRIGPTYAQIHYTRIPYADLVRPYTAACRQLHQRITQGLPGTGWWASGQNGEGPRPHPMPTDMGVGSPLLLREEVLRTMVTLLKGVIAQSARAPFINPVTHHNAYTCYVYLMLLRLGLRPRNTLPFTCEEFINPIEFLPISDKQSAVYFEERVLRLPPMVSKALTELAKGRRELQRWVFEEYAPHTALNMPKDLLLFLTDTGEVKRFHLSRFANLLQDWRLAALVDAPRNIGRHSIRSTFRQEHLADDVIDILMGHQRAGRGALELHAATFWGPTLGLHQERLEQHLVNLGFRHLNYFPFRRSS